MTWTSVEICDESIMYTPFLLSNNSLFTAAFSPKDSLLVVSAMFEPHLGFNEPNAQDMKSFNDDTTFGGNGSNLLAELDKMAPIKAFDAFPKVSLGCFGQH